MAILRYVKDSKDKHLLSLGIIEGEENAYYTVNESTYVEIGSPTSGDILSDGQMELIKETDIAIKARKKALSLLAYADNNKRNLMQKLCRAGFSRALSERVCLEMEELGYIDEKRQLERLITVEANSKLRGPDRIIGSLVSKGFSSADIKAVMHSLVDLGEIDFRKNAKVLIEKNLPDGNVEEKRKLLYKNGYKL